jgi:long-chain fatty acid transport protein
MVKKAFLANLIFWLIAGGAYAGGLALSGVGSKAIGMGGAFRGLADNWSAAYWNPAGLAQLSMSEFNVMGIGLTPKPEYTPQIRYGTYEIGYKNGEARYPDDKTSFAPNISGFYKMPAREDLTFGVALFVPYALGSKWDLFDPIYEDIVAAYPIIDHEGKLSVVDIHPSVAKSFMDNRLMLGAGLSIMRGEVDFQKVFLNPTSLPRPHDNVAVDAFIHGEGWGYGANFGLLYKISDKIQVGISGKTPTTLKLDGDVKSTLYAIDNVDLQNIALSQAATREDSVMINFIFSTEASGSRHWTRPASADLKLPADAGIGIAYNASEKMTLTLDLAYTLWSRLDKIDIEMEGSAPPDNDTTDNLITLKTEWDDILRFSIGGLYRYSEPLEFRFGFYYDPSPIPDETFSPLFLDVGTKYSGNLGAALYISDWEIGYNFEYIHFAERDIAYDINSGSDFDNYPGSFKAYLIANHVSVTYRF